MSRVAVLVDLAFFIWRYRSLVEDRAEPPHTPKEMAVAVWRTALKHIERQRGEQLYRVLVYDCRPLDKKAHNPLTKRAIDFSKTDAFRFRMELHHELVCLRKVALRLGELHDGRRWRIKADATDRLLRGEIASSDLTPEDVEYDTTQKGVDMKFGIDIASLAYKHLADRVVLITGDSDFVPAAKLARREGLDVVLDPLWNYISPSLHEHIDGLKSVWPKPGAAPRPPSTAATTGGGHVAAETAAQNKKSAPQLRSPWRRSKPAAPQA